VKILQLTVAAALLAAAAQAAEVEIKIDASDIVRPVSRHLTGVCIEDVNHEIYGGLYSQMIFGESFQEPPVGTGADAEVSGLWRPIHTGKAAGGFFIETRQPFVGSQCQQITFHGGAGEIGIENRGLNRWGLNFVGGKPYDGCIVARSAWPTTVWVTLESADGSVVYAAHPIRVSGKDWQRYNFVLTPTDADKSGRFAIKLRQSGTVDLGYAFLEPGDWGRYKGLPVRKDVADALLDEGVTVLRYGGSLVNTDEYRWKKMIGPREQRPPYRGMWYAHDSDGWGIFDFLGFCQAAGVLGIPAVNMNETPKDLADLVRYANAPADTEWGKRRAADGHPAPYHLTHLELGNEERVNDDYWRKFKPIAEAIWAADPDIILVVGDFYYGQVIGDPMNVTGGSVPTLAAHKQILDLAKERGREVWFDIHINTEKPPDPGDLAPQRSFIAALGQLSPGAKYRVAIFEFNANNHSMQRALANASAILQMEQIGGKLPVACSANGLQPDGQNDNGWNQGLLFLNPSQVWLQPPGWVTRMISTHYQPLLVKSSVSGAGADFRAIATRSQDVKTLVLQAVNTSDQPVTAKVHVDGFVTLRRAAAVEQLTAPLDSVNTAETPNAVHPTHTTWEHNGQQDATYVFPANSVTIITLE
jgi:hypothetical protein